MRISALRYYLNLFSVLTEPMSLHAQISPEAQARLRVQQRNSTITSIIIALLSVVLLGIMLLWILLPTVETFTPEIVSYHSGAEEEKQVQKRQITRAVERKPSAPSSSMARVIASNTQSNVAVPVPDINVAEPSTDFGDGDDFGDGWGEDDMSSGAGTTFFGQEVKGDHILYVIDYSLSMKGQREALMRAELAKSVMLLPGDKKYQMIFFAGPAWVACEKIQGRGKSFSATSRNGEEYKWEATNGIHGWTTIGERHKPTWLDATDSNIFQSETLIKKTSLVIGTQWDPPMAMAFDMEPLPNIIVFMTDGSAPGDPVEVAEGIASRAKKEGIVINTIALMEPKAADAMETLAKGTGGVFALINENGEKVDPGSIKPKKEDAKKRKKKK
jgi:hypothetical protein